MVENRVEFFQFMADLEPYLVEFDSEGKIKEGDYPPDCEVGEINRRPVICIIHDECTFIPITEKDMHGR